MPPKRVNNKITPQKVVNEMDDTKINDEEVEVKLRPDGSLVETGIEDGMPNIDKDQDDANSEGKDKNSTKSKASDVKSKELPPTCKACFLAFAEKISPACNHQFCMKCYKKLETKVCVISLQFEATVLPSRKF